jgi:hypothetical protein
MSTSATFVAVFEDGEITRMTAFQKTKALDLDRGVRLARAAYESRTKQRSPPIIEAYYERNGEVLESYEHGRLAAALRTKISRGDAS